MTGARRALVCQHRFPEHDRERGSLRVLEVIDALLAAGWHVSFASTSPEPAPRYHRELARRGVPCRTGWGDDIEAWVRHSQFDLAVVAFWHVAEAVAADLRAWSPATTVIVDSIDLHFVREARRRVVAGPDHHFDEAYGDMVARELEVYRAADGVLVVSEPERQMLDALLGRSVAHTVPLGEDITPSPWDASDRRGLLFVGNFRHLPNLEALSWLCREVMPHVDPELLDRHPLRVVGNAVDDRVRALCADVPGVDLVGWVPSVVPEIHRARVAVVPLRHGAGVKGKTLQALMAGTPVVSTPIGVEGIDLVAGEDVLIGATPRQFAAAITTLSSDDERWRQVAARGRIAVAPHRRSETARRLAAVVDDVCSASATRSADGIDDWGNDGPEHTRLGQATGAVAADLAAAFPPGAAAPSVDAVAGTTDDPSISVVIATFDRADLLDRCLDSVERQDLPPGDVEVVVVDDGSSDDTPQVLDRWSGRLRLVRHHIEHAGRSAAKNAGMVLATAPVILLLDDDDELAPDACGRHLAAHARHGAVGDVILGHTQWAPDLQQTPFMTHITDVGQQLFSYPSVPRDRALDWRHFWEGRLSLKSALVDLAIERGVGLHDERLAYTIDIEWAYRLNGVGELSVHYAPDALHRMARPVTLDEFCRRARAKGAAQWTISQMHPTEEIEQYCGLQILERWFELAGTIDLDRAEIAELERRLDGDDSGDVDMDRLHERYRRLITAHVAWGMADARSSQRPRPRASVVIPVWSASPDLVEVARATVARVREVSEDDLEVIVIDNGSPFGPSPLGDITVRNTENLGVSPAWNQGIRIASGEVVIVLNSDCRVEPGWDRALRHAACDGRRLAFPYTDHGDGAGVRQPDQAGTAGWCFALHRDLFTELGPFDVGFAPAFFEDTDYWHRAWERDVELTPVPAAIVHHERRTTARHLPDVESTFTTNRRRYEAKHGLALDVPPPFWARQVFDYPPPAAIRLRDRPAHGSTIDPDDPARPRVFGIGVSKTGTSSLHAALAHLGFRSIHHGDPALRAGIDAAIGAGRPPLELVDPRIDAFCDVPAVVDHFRRLDECLPSSRFVLTVRDLDELVDSHHRHAARNRHLRDAGLPHGELLDVDETDLRDRVRRHHDAVLDHFAGRPDQLLVLDVCAGDGWERLAPFVGWDRIPERAFPWENRDDGSASNEPAGRDADLTTMVTAHVALP